MTFTIEAEREALLVEEAQQRGMTLQQLINELLDQHLEDRADVEAAERSLAEPGASIPWESVKTELRL